MQVVLAEGLEIRQPLVAAIDGLRDCRLSREDGVTLLRGQLSELRCGEMLFTVFQRACDVTHRRPSYQSVQGEPGASYPHRLVDEPQKINWYGVARKRPFSVHATPVF